jgi:hypothetical protein
MLATSPMGTIGKFLQMIGLALTGYAAFSAFWIQVSEGQFITWGFGGFLLFVLGQWLRGKPA